MSQQNKTRAAACRRGGVDRARGIVWIEPAASVEVQYNEMMQGRLRDPVLRGASTARATRGY